MNNNEMIMHGENGRIAEEEGQYRIGKTIRHMAGGRVILLYERDHLGNEEWNIGTRYIIRNGNTVVTGSNGAASVELYDTRSNAFNRCLSIIEEEKNKQLEEKEDLESLRYGRYSFTYKDGVDY